MNPEWWRGKRILVTGGTGFLGKHLMKRLILAKVDAFDISSKKYDLRNGHQVQCCLSFYRPDVIIHLAAVCGGIGANRKRPGTFFYDNAMMGIQLIEEARKQEIQKFVCLGTVCSYPKFTPPPFQEDNLWNGYPEETNAPYGLAKKMLLVQLQAYREQYGFNGIYLLPVNLYGPGDNFDLETSHVIPAMIRKFYTAKVGGHDVVNLWGTGKATREFLYVEDCADAIIEATERYEKPAPMNIGTRHTLYIQHLAEKIAALMEYKGELYWDSSMPDGQPKRQLATGHCWSELGWEAKVDLNEGLKKTIDWYMGKMNEGISDPMLCS